MSICVFVCVGVRACEGVRACVCWCVSGSVCVCTTLEVGRNKKPPAISELTLPHHPGGRGTAEAEEDEEEEE